MSASTRTIQQPMSQGSIASALAMAVVTLAATLGIAWGAANLIGTKAVAVPVQAPIYLDKGSRDELGATSAARLPGSVLDRGDRFLLKETAPLSGSTSNGGHGGFRAQ